MANASKGDQVSVAFLFALRLKASSQLLGKYFDIGILEYP